MSISKKALAVAKLAADFAQAGYATATNEKVIADLTGKLTTANEKALGLAYRSGYVAGRLYGKLSKDTTAKAELVLAERQKGSKLPKRTKLESAAKRAADKRWERIRSALDVASSDKRGGARPVKGKGKGKGKAAPKGKVIKAAPLVKDNTQAIAHVRNMALMLSTFCKKNEKVISPDLSACVADFVGKVNSLS